MKSYYHLSIRKILNQYIVTNSICLQIILIYFKSIFSISYYNRVKWKYLLNNPDIPQFCLKKLN